jgi:hypothetical protein
VTFSYAAMTAHWAWPRANWTADTIRLSKRYQRFLLFGALTGAVIQERLELCLLAGGTAVIPEALPLFPDVLAQLRITAAPADRAPALPRARRAGRTGSQPE